VVNQLISYAAVMSEDVEFSQPWLAGQSVGITPARFINYVIIRIDCHGRTEGLDASPWKGREWNPL
jgi:hypothetical protein